MGELFESPKLLGELCIGSLARLVMIILSFFYRFVDEWLELSKLQR